MDTYPNEMRLLFPRFYLTRIRHIKTPIGHIPIKPSDENIRLQAKPETAKPSGRGKFYRNGSLDEYNTRCRDVAQLGSALPWGGRGHGFESRRSDQTAR